MKAEKQWFANRGQLATGGNTLLIALLALITFIALFPSLSCGFVEWDDPAYLLENELLNKQSGILSFENIRNIFSSDVNGNYNPLPIFTFAIEKFFFSPEPEASPFIFHFNNLLLHIVNTVLVFAIMFRLGLNSFGAFIAALLFGIHPMRVESVAWVTERKDVLYGLFYLGAILSYLKYVGNTASKKWFWITLLLSFFSLLSKIQAVCLPLAFVAIDYYTGRKWLHPKNLIFEKLPWWTLSIAFGLINLHFLNAQGYLDTTGAYANYNIIDRLAVGAYSYGIYLIKLIYPHKLTHFHDYPAQLPATAYAALALIPLLTVLFLLWVKKRRLSFLFFGWLFFTVHVFFLLQIVPVGNAFQADRFTYIAYLGLFFIAGKAYQLLAKKQKQKQRYISAGLVVYFTILAIATYAQTYAWKDTISLCEQHISCYPDSYYGYNQAGIYYLQNISSSANNDDFVYRVQKAERYFKEADRADSVSGRKLPNISSDIYVNLGIVSGMKKDTANAIYNFTRAIAANPDNEQAYKNRGHEYFTAKQYPKAIADLTKALQLEPDDHMMLYKRANCYYSSLMLDAAENDLNKAILLSPQNPNYYIARSVVKRAKNDSTGAIRDAQLARRFGGKVPDSYLAQ